MVERVLAAHDRAACILNVDDAPDGLDLKSYSLRAAGCAVIEAATGQAALSALGEHAIDLVLLDINLPDIDGLEICHRLRQDPDRTLLPIILITSAYIEQEDRVRGLAAGADSCLTQPTDPAVLIEVVRALLRRAAAEERQRIERDVAVAARARVDRRHRALFENAPYGILHSTAEGRIIDVNPALSRILGYVTPAALIAVGDAKRLYRDPETRAGMIGRAAGTWLGAGH